MATKKNQTSSPQQAHNNFVQLMLECPEHRKQLLRKYLPTEVIKKVDIENSKVLPNHFIEANLRKFTSDTLIKIKKNDGSDAYIYSIVEMKSSPDILTAPQVLLYTLQVMLKFADKSKEKPLPLVLPLVLHHGETEFKYPLNYLELVDGDRYIVDEFLANNMKLIDVCKINTEELLNKEFFPLDVSFAMLKHTHDSDIIDFLHDNARLILLLQDYAAISGEKLALALLHYLFAKANISDNNRFFEFSGSIKAEFQGVMMGAEQMAINKGEAIGYSKGKHDGISLGVKKGRQEGRQETATDIAKKMLANNISVADVSRFTGLPINKIKQLNLLKTT